MKKGQVTIFVILGIVLVIVVSLFLTIRSKTQTITTEIEISDDSEVKQVQLFVTNCLSSVSREGIEKIGLSGGNLNLRGLKVSPIPTDSDVFVFEPNNIPYWHYLRDCEQSSIGCIASNQPALCKPGSPCVLDGMSGVNSIEEQLSTYVKDNLNHCISNFKYFKNQFEIKEKEEPEVGVIIGDGNVVFNLNYPLDIKSLSNNVQESITDFSTKLDVNFKDIFELANGIIEAEREFSFIEKTVLNLISIYSGMSQDLLPPTSEVKIFGSVNELFWFRNKVEEQLQYEVLPYTSLIQFQNTLNSYNPIFADEDDPNAAYINGIWSTFDIYLGNLSTYQNLKSNIIYTYAPIYLSIGNSELIRPKKIDLGDAFYLKMMGALITDYRFKYDISYPLIITITQDDAFNGEGYEFSFAVEVNIRNNVPVNGDMTFTEIRTPFITSFDSQSQLVNKTITIKTIDKHTRESLDNVLISYYCGYMLDIGGTIQSNNEAILEVQMPFCQFGGKIIYEKNGYLGGYEDFNNLEGDQDKTFTFELWPSVEKKIQIFKRTADNINTLESAGAGSISLYEDEVTNLSTYEKVILNVGRQKQSYFEVDIPLVGVLLFKPENATDKSPADIQRQNVENLYSQGEIDDAQRQELLNSIANTTLANSEDDAQEYLMEFVPGTYDVEATLIDEENITIPEETRYKCKNGGFCSPFVGKDDFGNCLDHCSKPTGVLNLWDIEDSVVFEEQKIPTWMSGGAIFNFTLNEQQVYNDKDLIFYVLEIPIPEDWDDMFVIETIEDYQIGRESYIDPLTG